MADDHFTTWRSLLEHGHQQSCDIETVQDHASGAEQIEGSTNTVPVSHKKRLVLRYTAMTDPDWMNQTGTQGHIHCIVKTKPLSCLSGVTEAPVVRIGETGLGLVSVGEAVLAKHDLDMDISDTSTPDLGSYVTVVRCSTEAAVDKLRLCFTVRGKDHTERAESVEIDLNIPSSMLGPAVPLAHTPEQVLQMVTPPSSDDEEEVG